jgi:hypothetical protein
VSQARFSIIPGWIVTDTRLKGRDLQVLCLLGRYTDRQGWCVRSQVKMAGQLGCARSTVQLSLDRLVEIGAVERRAGESRDGRDTSYWYRVIYDRAVAAEDMAGWYVDSDSDSEGDDGLDSGPESVGNDSVSGAGPARTPADISAPPADPGSAPPADPGSAPYKNDPQITAQAERREREARARDRSDGGDEGTDAADIPGRADFEKRVMRFCTGRGFTAGQWTNWDTSSPGHIGKMFALLSSDERLEAERWRDAFLHDLTRRKVSPPPVANYLRDRMWQHLDPVLLERAEAAAKGVPVPDDYAPPLGPVWSALVHGLMIEGPEHPEHAPAAGQIWLRVQIEKAWPKIASIFTAAALRRGVRAGARWQALKDAMEFVPKDSPLFAAWRAEAARRGWPALPSIGDMAGMYFPAGGPEALDAFAAKVRAAEGNGECGRAAE